MSKWRSLIIMNILTGGEKGASWHLGNSITRGHPVQGLVMEGLSRHPSSPEAPPHISTPKLQEKLRKKEM